MKKRIVTALLVLLLLSCIPFTVLGAEEMPLIVDHAGLFTSDEISNLEAQAKAIAETYDMDVVILTENTLSGKSPQDYADDYYDTMGYGQGAKASGMLLLIAMEQRDWYLSTCGDAIYALTDYATEELGEKLVSGLQIGYAVGVRTFLNALPTYLDAYADGSPIDGYSSQTGSFYHGDRETVIHYGEHTGIDWKLSLILGLTIAAISVGAMIFSMNSKRPQRNASNYLNRGSCRLLRNQDLYLYSNVTKTRKPEPQNHSGGGSSVHHSSGGRSYGGGGGKF